MSRKCLTCHQITDGSLVGFLAGHYIYGCTEAIVYKCCDNYWLPMYNEGFLMPDEINKIYSKSRFSHNDIESPQDRCRLGYESCGYHSPSDACFKHASLLDATRKTVCDLYRRETAIQIKVTGKLRHQYCHDDLVSPSAWRYNELGYLHGMCNHPSTCTQVLQPPDNQHWYSPTGMSVDMTRPEIDDRMPIPWATQIASVVKPERGNDFFRVYVLPKGSYIPEGVEIIYKQTGHATLYITSQQRVTIDINNDHTCHIHAIASLPWEPLGITHARGQHPPQWLRDHEILAVLVTAIDNIIDLSVDVDLVDAAFDIGANMAKFGADDVAKDDFVKHILQPLQGLLNAFLESCDYDPDEISNILIALDVLGKQSYS